MRLLLPQETETVTAGRFGPPLPPPDVPLPTFPPPANKGFPVWWDEQMEGRKWLLELLESLSLPEEAPHRSK